MDEGPANSFGAELIFSEISGAIDSAALTRFHQALQHPHIALLVARFVDRSLGNKRRMRKSLVVQQSPERLNAHGSLADVLVPVELGAARSFGVVAVPHANSLEPHRLSNLLHGLCVAFVADHVVAGDSVVARAEHTAHA